MKKKRRRDLSTLQRALSGMDNQYTQGILALADSFRAIPNLAHNILFPGVCMYVE